LTGEITDIRKKRSKADTDLETITVEILFDVQTRRIGSDPILQHGNGLRRLKNILPTTTTTTLRGDTFVYDAYYL